MQNHGKPAPPPREAVKETPSRNEVSFTPYPRGSLTYLHIAITWPASRLLILGTPPTDCGSEDPRSPNVQGSL